MQEGERCKMHVDVGCYGARGIARDVDRPKAAISELLRHPNVLGIKAFLSPLPPNAGGGGMPGDNARSAGCGKSLRDVYQTDSGP